MSRIIPILPAGKGAGARLEFTLSPPLSLYIHLPWCVQKCPYCDFNSHEARGEIPESAYLDALVADLESALPLIWGRPVVSLFFGGGTPSLFSAEGIDRLLMAVRARVPLPPGAEITLEANPGTVEAEKFAGFRAAGINRVSLGIQSFNPAHLKALGRIHDRDEALHAAALAARHFERFNLDLMYGLPGQSLDEALADLDTALSLGPRHLSCYQLTLEPNTRFAAFPPELPEPDLCADIEEAFEARLAEAGFEHYETSAFARPGQQCRHNLNYWHFGDYLGIGAGAHSKLTLPDRVLRQMRWKRPEAYLKEVAAGRPVQEEFAVEAAQLPFEFLLNALRLNGGFPPALFEARTGQPLITIQAPLQAAVRDGLLDMKPDWIAPTATGRRFLNRLLQYFL
ncbi:MAG: radical SAM family heme chaperone HemW [Azovibrio sp.]|uniref:radical SAM family heme chaperone HemW n=1 Tax=Azovibrio sp. TaxID=1872673 RepID=UPI003C77A198